MSLNDMFRRPCAARRARWHSYVRAAHPANRVIYGRSTPEKLGRVYEVLARSGRKALTGPFVQTIPPRYLAIRIYRAYVAQPTLRRPGATRRPKSIPSAAFPRGGLIFSFGEMPQSVLPLAAETRKSDIRAQWLSDLPKRPRCLPFNHSILLGRCLF